MFQLYKEEVVFLLFNCKIFLKMCKVGYTFLYIIQQLELLFKFTKVASWSVDLVQHILIYKQVNTILGYIILEL